MKEIVNDIIAIIECIILIILCFIVGTPLTENTKIITISVIVLFAIYLVIYKLVLKNKYIDIFREITIMDICVVVLFLSPLIPIFFKTALDIEKTINVAIRYFTVLQMYMLTKIMVLQNSKYKNYFCITLIIIGVISTIIEIDNMSFNFLNDFLAKLKIPKFPNKEQRMFANFGYANTFAISLAMPLLLCIDKYIK